MEDYGISELWRPALHSDYREDSRALVMLDFFESIFKSYMLKSSSTP